MDYVLKLIILFVVSGSVFAVPAKPSFQISRAGTTTTYKVVNDGSGTGVPLNPSSAGTGIKVIDGVYNSSGTGYQTNAKIGVEIPAVKVSNAVSVANLAAAVITVIPKFTAAGLVIAAGTAIYDYLNNAGMHSLSDGTLVADIATVPSVSGCPSPRVSDGWSVYATGSGGALYSTINGTGVSCPGGATVISGSCISTQGQWQTLCRLQMPTPPPPVPVTSADAKSKLIATPPTTPDDYARIIKEVHDHFAADDPVAASPTVQAPSSPSVGAPQQSVNPDGTTQTKTPTTIFTQPSPDTIVGTESTTVQTTHPDGTTTTTTINNAPPLPPAEPPKTDCEKYPDNIGCAKFGDAPTPEVLPVTNVPISLNPISLGNGSCPVPISMATSRGTFSLSLQPLCDYATMISYLFISLCWLMAGYIVLGSIRE